MPSSVEWLSATVTLVTVAARSTARNDRRQSSANGDVLWFTITAETTVSPLAAPMARSLDGTRRRPKLFRDPACADHWGGRAPRPAGHLRRSDLCRQRGAVYPSIGARERYTPGRYRASTLLPSGSRTKPP